MLLRDEILFCASVLRDGAAGPYHQIIASRRLVRIADDIARLEELADGIVGEARDTSDAEVAAAHSERALVPLRAPARLRLVRA